MKKIHKFLGFSFILLIIITFSSLRLNALVIRNLNFDSLENSDYQERIEVSLGDLLFDVTCSKVSDGKMILGNPNNITYSDQFSEIINHITTVWNVTTGFHIIQTSANCQEIDSVDSIKFFYSNYTANFSYLYLFYKESGYNDIRLAAARSFPIINFFKYIGDEFSQIKISYFALVCVESEGSEVFPLDSIEVISEQAAIEKVNVYLYNGASLFKTLEVIKGRSIQTPSSITLSGFEFNGWYLYNSDTPYNFDTPINEPLHLFARFSRVSFEKTVLSYLDQQHFDEGGAYAKNIVYDNPDGYQFHFSRVMVYVSAEYNYIQINEATVTNLIPFDQEIKKIVINYNSRTILNNKKNVKVYIGDQLASTTSSFDGESITYTSTALANDFTLTTSNALYIDNIEIYFYEKEFKDLVLGVQSSINENSVHLRLISNVYNQDFINFGFEIVLIKNDVPIAYTIKYCSKLVSTLTSSIESLPSSISASELESEYLFALTILNVPFDSTFYLRAFVYDKDYWYSEYKIYQIDQFGQLKRL